MLPVQKIGRKRHDHGEAAGAFLSGDGAKAPISPELRPGRFPQETLARCLSPQGELRDREPRAALRAGG